MIEAFVAALSGGLATKAGEGVASATSSVLSSLVRAVRGRIGSELVAVEQAPDDQGARAALAEALVRVTTEDPEFAARFRDLWQRAEVEIHAGQVVINNNYSRLPGEKAGPRQVRAFVGPYFDRVLELATLRRNLTGDRTTGVAIVMVIGMPGAGKRALISRGVALFGDRFPGGHVHIDYTAMSGPEAAAKALRAVGVDERFIPERPADQIDLLRSRTALREPMLFVLDGVTDPAQVLPLVPSAPGSAVVVTSEYKLADLVKEGAKVIEIGGLPEPDAVALLADMCGDDRVAGDPAAAKEVVRLCGYLAAAVRVAGARLTLDPSLAVAELAGELADEANRLDVLSLPGWSATGVPYAVAAAFAVSYERLPAAAQQLYLGLGVVALDSCTPDLAAAVAGTNVPAARQALQTLAAASLLERAGRDRFRMHPLIRLHAARQAAIEDPDGPAATLHRVVASLLAFTGWADRAVMGGDRLRPGHFDPIASGRPDPFTGPNRRQAALAALEAERANLLIVVRAAADAGLDEQVWQLALALTALYLNHRHHADWIETTRLAVQAARIQRRYDVVARLCSVVSRAYQDLGDLPTARTRIEGALEASSHVDDPVLAASVWEMYGRYLEHVDRAEAEAAYRKALDLNLEAGQQRGAALVRYFLGGCLDAAGRRDEALALLNEALDWLSGRDDRMAARCRYTLGVARLHGGDLAGASRDLRAAADYFAVQGLWHYEVPARTALADLSERLGDRDGERREVNRALEVEQAAGGLRVDDLRRRLDGLD